MTSGTAALTMADAMAFAPVARAPVSPGRGGRLGGRLAELRDWLETADLVPDLGNDIGSREWWRGLGTLALLCGCAIATDRKSVV